MQDSRYYLVFDPLTLFGGVYTGTHRSVQRIVDEVGVLKELGVNAVYLENDKQQQGDLKIIFRALEQIVKSFPDYKVGLNLLPNKSGKEILTSYALASYFRLPFIINDMIVGTHNRDGKTLETNYILLFKQRDAHPEIILLGGMNPPYAPLEFPVNEPVNLSLARKITDAMTVKVTPKEYKEGKELSEERIRLYAGGYANSGIDTSVINKEFVEGLTKGFCIDQFAGTKPAIVIPASGINAQNIERIARYENVGGLIIGSALRNKETGLLYPPFIIELVEKLARVRDERYSK